MTPQEFNTSVKDRLKEEFDQLAGQFVLYDIYSAARFIGIIEGDDDFYYVIYDGRKIIYHSCVMSIYQLKDKIEDIAYDEMVRIAKLNHHDYLYPTPQTYRKHLENTITDKILFGLKWE